MKLTLSEIKALEAVRLGVVYQRFDITGNVFECPRRVSPVTARKLQEAGLIESVRDTIAPGRYRQQLTAKGMAALHE